MDFDNLFKTIGLSGERSYQPVWIKDSKIDTVFNGDEQLVNYYQKSWVKRTEQFKVRFDKIRTYISNETNVLDLGCNTGWNSFESYHSGANMVTGIDSLHAKAGEYIRIFNDIEESKISFHEQRSMEFLKRKDSYHNIIIHFLLLHHLIGGGDRKLVKGFTLDRNEMSDRSKMNLDECSKELELVSSQCDIAFLQLRIVSGLDVFQHYLESFFSKVIVIPIEKNGFAAPHPVYKCVC